MIRQINHCNFYMMSVLLRPDMCLWHRNYKNLYLLCSDMYLFRMGLFHSLCLRHLGKFRVNRLYNNDLLGKGYCMSFRPFLYIFQIRTSLIYYLILGILCRRHIRNYRQGWNTTYSCCRLMGMKYFAHHMWCHNLTDNNHCYMIHTPWHHRYIQRHLRLTARQVMLCTVHTKKRKSFCVKYFFAIPYKMCAYSPNQIDIYLIHLII